MLPVKPTVFILLVTQHTEEGISTAAGPVFFNRIDASAAARRFPYDSPTVHVLVIERQVRGDMPVPQAAHDQAGPHRERANSPEEARAREPQ